MAPAVSVVVVNYNGASVLPELLDSIAASDVVPLEVIVVDNASTDASRELLARRPGVTLIAAGGNVGASRAYNLGAARARGDLLLFCDADAALRPETLRVLTAHMATAPRAGVVAPTLVEPDAPPHIREDRLEAVAAMSFATALVSREAYDRLGGFHAPLFVYWNDTEFCYRSILAGFGVYKAWDAVADHALHGSGGGSRWASMQVAHGLYVYLKLRSWPATARFALRMAIKTAMICRREASTAPLSAWNCNLVALRPTLRERRTLRGGAAPVDRKRLDALAAEHDLWARRAYRYRQRARLGTLRRRLGGGSVA